VFDDGFPAPVYIYSAIARVRNGLDSVTAGAAPRGRKGQFPLGWRIAQLVS
jgi:hypothetical protein